MRTSLPLRSLTVLGLFLAALPVGQAEAAPPSEGVKPPWPEQADSTLVSTISAGGYQTCALKSDGTLA